MAELGPSPDAMSCIVCGKPLRNIFPDAVNQPEDAVTFYSYGQYGSRVYDDLGRTAILVNICDTDLVAAAKKAQVMKTTPRPQPDPRMERWTPDRYAVSAVEDNDAVTKETETG